jgi:choline dehydrogenase-like flavoprotein
MSGENQHDVVVIGSGCTGGTAAWQLSRRGLRVLLLEAGDHVAAHDSKPDSRLGTHLSRVWRVLIARCQQTQSLHPAYWLYPPRLFIDDKKHPYSTPEGRPFVWIRGRQVGGRSLTWTGLALRLSPYELEEWPLVYEDLAPHYDEVEGLMGICGGHDRLPQLPDGNYRPAKPLTPAESIFKDRIRSRWPERHVIIGRGADDTPGQGWSLKTSLGSTLEAARRTGLLEKRANSIARRLAVDERSGRVSAVEIIDSKTRATGLVPARAVVVCASTLESVRLLLNSHSAAHPNGLGNSSGLLGRYIMNKVSRSVIFEMPLDQTDGIQPLSASESFVIPRYENVGSQTAEMRGGFGIWGAIQRLPPPPQKRAAGARASASGILVGYGECLPYVDNKLELNADALDEWGIPTLRIDVRWRENEEQMAERIERDLRAMVAAAGGSVVAAAGSAGSVRRHLAERVRKAGSIPGAFVHEIGGARMGASPDHSVVNAYCQVWDAKNVFVTDGACWPTAGWQNPTLTMMAITARSCSFIADAFARDDL